MGADRGRAHTECGSREPGETSGGSGSIRRHLHGSRSPRRALPPPPESSHGRNSTRGAEMAMTRWDPMAQVERMQRELDRMFGRVETAITPRPPVPWAPEV